MPELPPVGGGEAADHRCEGRGSRPPLGLRQCLEEFFPERPRGAPPSDELPRGGDDLQRVRLALVRRVAPGGDAVPAEDHADGRRVVPLDRGDVEAELEPRPPPRHPRHAVAEALGGQRLAVGGCGERDACVRVQVVHVRGLDKAVHRGVDGRRRAALCWPTWPPPAQAERAVVERRDHLVLALDTRIDTRQVAQRRQPQHGQARLGERAEVAARAFHPQQFGRLPGDRIGGGALRGGVPARVVGGARIGAEPVAAREQRADCVVHQTQAPQPAGEPPVRSEIIFSPYPDARYAETGSGARPSSSRSPASSGRTSVL